MMKNVAIIGAGPSGLIAAEVLSLAGWQVDIFDQMPSPARKFLMAGRGGLNLTHSEPFERFVTRYGRQASHLRAALDAFAPKHLRAWADELGAETFVGTSGRVFPKAMKASPLLRAWLKRLASQGVRFHMGHRLVEIIEGGVILQTGTERFNFSCDRTFLAMGGASWPRLGSDGRWLETLANHGVEIVPLKAANVGFGIKWSELFAEKFAGTPLKNIAISHGAKEVKGEVMLTRHGIEGGSVYALSASLRDAIIKEGVALAFLDLRPDLSPGQVASKLGRASPKDSLSNRLRKTLNLSPAAIALVHETQATDIKAIALRLTEVQGLDRAISTAGGIAFSGLTRNFELKGLPGVYAVGEMLDWEAPTGGYLLQACFSTAVMAARSLSKP